MNHSIIIPCLTYKDAKAAIEWICKAFGFQKHLVIDGDNNTIVHSELTFNGGMIMVGSSDTASAWGKYIKLPSSLGDYETQSPYIIVKDIEAHYQRAKTHGAKIVIELKAEDYGGKNYSCMDPEGHLWSFGSYDPWTSAGTHSS